MLSLSLSLSPYRSVFLSPSVLPPSSMSTSVHLYMWCYSYPLRLCVWLCLCVIVFVCDCVCVYVFVCDCVCVYVLSGGQAHSSSRRRPLQVRTGATDEGRIREVGFREHRPWFLGQPDPITVTWVVVTCTWGQCTYRIVHIISPWAIFLTSALNRGGGLIIHTELIIYTCTTYVSYTYMRTLSRRGGIHHGLIIRTMRYMENVCTVNYVL